MPAKLPHHGLRWVLIALVGVTLACSRSVQPGEDPSWKSPGQEGVSLPPTATPFSFLPPTRQPGAPIFTPTPDAPHQVPVLRAKPEQYVVQSGDMLGNIADSYGVSVEQIMLANKLNNPDVLDVGQVLDIPVPTPEGVGPDFKIISDSELVYGPVSAYFDLPGFIKSQGGYLAGYSEKINTEEKKLSGAEIVRIIAQDYSVNPRLLLAVLEHQSGWISRAKPDKTTLDYPIGRRDLQAASLYHQLAWAANNLNRGYYLWRVNGVASWVLGDGRVVPIAATLNAGTAGVQHFFAQLYNYKEWKQAVSSEGFFVTYNRLFGYPFDLAVEPLIPAGLSQPQLKLPFEKGVKWAFTGGPHAGWDSGSAWAALDFAPDREALGCAQSDEWVVAAGDGLVVRAGDGIVIQDLNDPASLPIDGLEQSGWVMIYMHIESRGRVEAGTYLQAGERIGHPSCEGGISSGTHVHIARRYNGEWISADQNIPFVLEGWVSFGTGVEYEGYLERDNQKVIADASSSATGNSIKR
jgi:LysM repeat protein